MTVERIIQGVLSFSCIVIAHKKNTTIFWFGLKESIVNEWKFYSCTVQIIGFRTVRRMTVRRAVGRAVRRKKRKEKLNLTNLTLYNLTLFDLT